MTMRDVFDARKELLFQRLMFFQNLNAYLFRGYVNPLAKIFKGKQKNKQNYPNMRLIYRGDKPCFLNRREIKRTRKINNQKRRTLYKAWHALPREKQIELLQKINLDAKQIHHITIEQIKEICAQTFNH